MPTVLIADDNSNIQKMVALALKGDDQSIEVVAVGNGEAALRKAREIIPDLVLADIFMPVRGGYEVCELVKQDTRLAHIPVVLLAGAFDPFDEPEARRVGADGVLKKPFVPADPLIAMVKDLLSKRSTPVLVPVAGQAEAASQGKEVSAQTKSAISTPFDIPGPSDMDDATPHKGFTLPAGQLAASNHEGALAFGGDVEATEGDSPFSTGAESISFSEHVQKEPASIFEGTSTWSPTISAAEHAPATIPDEVDIEPPVSLRSEFAKTWAIEQDSASHEEEETVVEPLDRFAAMHYVPSAIEQEKTTFAEESAPEEVAPPMDEVSTTIISRDEWEPSVPEIPVQQAYGVESTPTPSSEPATDPANESKESPEQDFEPEQAAVPFDFSKFDLAHPPETAQHFSSGSSEINHDSVENVVTESESAQLASATPAGPAASTNSFPVPTPAVMDPHTIEEIVSRVIARLQPQLLEIITREVLKPVVESLVRRQLDSE